MNILITGSVLNANNESIAFYNDLEKVVSKKYKVIGTPLKTMKFNGTDTERYHRAMELVRESDLIIAELSTPSTGQGMELQEAARLNKQVIVLSKTNSKISGLIKGANIIKDIIFYDNIKDLKVKLLESLNH